MPALPALLLALTALDPPSPPPQPVNPIQVIGTRHYYGPPFISPMGEPFRQRVPYDDPLADWFHQADRNHDGYLTADEMVQDAYRFFDTLDINHDGVIDPEEIERYEQEVAPEVGGEPLALQGPVSVDDTDPSDLDTSDVDENKQATRIKGGGDDDQSDTGAGRFALIDIPEPVAAADTDLSRSVSRDEFRRAAILRFNLLDSKHEGRITLAELERYRR
jgi:Ca2+-binding EF-hand superfamily protein